MGYHIEAYVGLKIFVGDDYMKYIELEGLLENCKGARFEIKKDKNFLNESMMHYAIIECYIYNLTLFKTNIPFFFKCFIESEIYCKAIDSYNKNGYDFYIGIAMELEDQIIEKKIK